MFLNKSSVSKGVKNFDSDHRYKNKYRMMKKYIVSLVYENAAICDQITYLQDKILYVKEETNFLVRKLKHIEFLRNTGGIEMNSSDVNFKKLIIRRKLPSAPIMPDSLPQKSPLKLKKPANKSVKKKQSLSAIDENSGQISFPISISDDLSLHCLGEIVFDRSSFHVDDMIYPAGYVSRKIYASSRNPKLKAVYTCKIVDAGLFPRFEIIHDEGPIFLGSTPDECHQKLLARINSNYSMKVVNDNNCCGSDFFGLTNPTVHYFILSLPDASKCLKYNFKKFSEKLAAKEDLLIKDDVDACLNYSALQKMLPESYVRDRFVGGSWLSG